MNPNNFVRCAVVSCFLFAGMLSNSKSEEIPTVNVRILHVDEPPTEEEIRQAEQGESFLDAIVYVPVPQSDSEGEESKIPIYLPRLKLSPVFSIEQGSALEIFKSQTDEKPFLRLNVPSQAGEILVVLKASRAVDFTDATASIIPSHGKDFSDGQIRFLNITGKSVGVRFLEDKALRISPGGAESSIPPKGRRDTVPMEIYAGEDNRWKEIWGGVIRVRPGTKVTVVISSNNSDSEFGIDYVVERTPGS